MRASKAQQNVKYEFRTVAFIDIIGFSELVDRSLKDESFFMKLHYALRIVENQGRVWAAQTFFNSGESKERMKEQIADMDFRSQTFSDCIILSQRGGAVGLLFLSVAQLAMALLDLGILVRGGIAQGPLFHESAMVFGPALIEAYNLENRCAKFPRILVSQGVYYVSHNEMVTFPEQGTHAVYQSCEFLRRDVDRMYHLDYLTTTLLSPSVIIGADDVELLKRLKKMAALTLDEFQRTPRDVDTKAKWGWFLDYFNDFARVRTSHIPDLFVAPLVLDDDEMNPVVTWDDLRRGYYSRNNDIVRE